MVGQQLFSLFVLLVNGELIQDVSSDDLVDFIASVIVD